MPTVKSLDLGEDNEKVYDDLIVAVEASDEVLSLLLAVCDEPQLRDEIIQRYEAELQPRIRPYQVTLSRKEPSLREAIAEVVKNDSYLQSGGRTVITVTGADRLLSRRLGEERSEKEIFFGYLQWTRESLREYPYPIILWLTNPLLTELSRKAPDFWSWRKDVFRFQSVLNGQNVQQVFGGQGLQVSNLNAPIIQVEDNVTLNFGGSPNRNLLSSVYKRPLPPEIIEYDSIPLEDLQQLINQTDQQQGNDPLLGTLYSQLGRAYASRVKPDEIEASQATIEQAIEWFQKATRVQEALGIIVDLAKNLSWLGYIYELKGNYVEAEPILQQALTILEQQLGSNHPSVANTLHNLSVSYVLQGRYAEANSILQQKSLSIPNNLPYSGTPRFIGREAELAQLHEQLQRSDRIAISAIAGMGGIGKTELALQYALKHLGDGTYSGGICWVRAHQDIGMQILAFARSYLDLEPPEDLDLVAKVIWCWWHWHQGEVLVIFDDVTDFSSIKSFLPPTDLRFKVLLTTRLRLGASVNQVFLDVLPDSAALEFLRSIVGDERINYQLEDAQALCAWLGYLPLALELAARYLASRRDLSVTSLLDRLQRQKLAAKALARPEVGMTANLSIAAAFELSWHELSESAQQLAGWLSLFALTPIPWELVEACISESGTESDAETLEDLRDELINLNLLRRMIEQTYQIHPLIREFFVAKLEQMPKEVSMKQAFCREMVAVAKQIPSIPTRQLIQTIAPVIPHIAEAATTLETWLTDDDLIIPYIGISRFYQGQAAYEQALPWLEQCLHIAETRLGSDHPYIATSLNNLAYLYQLQGRYSEAEPLYLRSLAIYEQQLGAEHPDTAQSLNNLAELYRSMGRYGEAEPLYVRSLAIREQQLGTDHPDTAQGLNNLAELYQAMGRYGEAEPLYVRSLAIYEQQLGAEHPYTALSLNNLAELYRSMGRYGEAEPLYVRSLAIYEQQLGVDHPAVSTSLNNLAELYKLQGRYAEAEPLLLRSLSISEQLLGSDHPITATILNNLAALYYEQGSYSGAEALYARSLAVREQQLGAEHPDVATSLNNLAYLYQVQGRYGEAKPLLLRALQIYETQLGSDHPSTASSLNNLAELYLAMGRYGEAEPLLLRALQIYEAQLGSDHPSTASSLNNLAELYLAMGRYGEAEPLLLRSLMIREQLLGTDHPATAMSLNNLADLYYHQNRLSEAEALLTRALAIRERILGENHPDTLNTQKLLARLRQGTDTSSEADRMDKLAMPKTDILEATRHNKPLARNLREDF
ncbi:MAG: tetratricopeptide repeat protein [Microcystis sp. M038S1]|uniref:FxSxx-COOH system tetratricopeptide repeat protein n=1 Tax=unclassified Microcystis TaxID=2643300 RepID=UPI002589A8BD|nr:MULTISPECIES: FxSxx-COOH system tetratricopeptide repeat protein [unclassified Microcystis]MCA2865909.1 tetratricopeptide repeat protein [Microcystis sp. M049S1]MCA2923433.1 tetratricopeptide repeat protein [Microcystis sp. M038S1]MCA6519922.1 tetratricopeptide repeat protein [Pseudanabaena sp. M110S1SP2A07QC]